MYYKIVEAFGPKDGQRWTSYLNWRGLELERFDSIDGILRPDLFEPTSVEDWRHCVNQDYQTSFLTDLSYTQKILERYEHAVVVGVEFEWEENAPLKPGLLGFDIVDDYFSISLLTNWGTAQTSIMNEHMMANGLVGNLHRALELCHSLKREFPDDSHAADCGVCAVYKVA